MDIPEGPEHMDVADSDGAKSPDIQAPQPNPNEILCAAEEPMLQDPPAYNPNDPLQNTYLLVRERFEQECFKVRQGSCFARIENHENAKDKDAITLLKHSQMRDYYSYLNYFEWDVKNQCYNKKCFINEWLRDYHSKDKEVLGLVCDPKHESPGYYNTWKGFKADRLPPIEPERVDGLVVNLIYHVTHVFCNGIQEHADWLLDWFAQIIQDPSKPSKVAVMLYGEQGIGKDIFLDWFRFSVLGDHCTYQTSDPEKRIFSKFCLGRVDKVFIQIDEVKDLKNFCELLKDVITGPTFSYEYKNGLELIQRNMNRVIFTTNNKNALKIEPGDRRHVMFHCSDKFKGDYSYFDKLDKDLQNPEVTRAFIDHLRLRDLSRHGGNFEKTRPITSYYIEAGIMNIPFVARYLSALVNEKFNGFKKSSEMFKDAKALASACNYVFKMGPACFVVEVKSIAGRGAIYHRIGGGGPRGFNVDCTVLKNHLEATSRYDPDIDSSMIDVL